MRKMKKAAALFMAAAMAASLSACGGGSSTGTTTAPTQAPAAEGSEAEGGASADVDTSSFEGLDAVSYTHLAISRCVMGRTAGGGIYRICYYGGGE